MIQTIKEAAREYVNIPPVQAALKFMNKEDLRSHIVVAFENGARFAAQNTWISVKDELPETLSLFANCSCECFVLVREKDYLSGTTGHYRGDRQYWVALQPNGKGGYEYRKADVEYWMPMPTTINRKEVKYE